MTVSDLPPLLLLGLVIWAAVAWSRAKRRASPPNGGETPPVSSAGGTSQVPRVSMASGYGLRRPGTSAADNRRGGGSSAGSSSSSGAGGSTSSSDDGGGYYCEFYSAYYE